jgi:hypothetical protein
VSAPAMGAEVARLAELVYDIGDEVAGLVDRVASMERQQAALFAGMAAAFDAAGLPRPAVLRARPERHLHLVREVTR